MGSISIKCSNVNVLLIDYDCKISANWNRDIFKEFLFNNEQTWNDQEKIMKGWLPDENQKQTKYSGDEEEVSGTFRAPFPHLSRTCRAIIKRERCLTCVRNVPDMGGVSTDYLLLVCKWSGSVQRSIKKWSKNVSGFVLKWCFR